MGRVVAFRTPRQKRIVAIHGSDGGGARIVVVPPLSHADHDRRFGSFDEAVAAGVALARETGWRIFDFTGRIPHSELLDAIGGAS